MDLKQLNAGVLRQQHLHYPAAAGDLERVVTDIGGLHATTATSPFLSLFARCQGFKKEHLTDALFLERRLVRMRCMRKTIFILPKNLVPIAHAATHRLVIKTSRRHMEAQGVSSDDYERTAAQISELLEKREMTANELKTTLACSLPLSAILQLMCDQALLVRARPKGSWRASQLRYARFVDYFPDLVLGSVDEVDATAQLIERYLYAFGPATENDIVWWLGLGKRRVQAGLRLLQERVAAAALSVRGIDGKLIALRKENRTPDCEISRVDPAINLLPCLDPYVMGYIERERYLDTAYSDYVFDRSGNATSTILVDGRVVGVWDFQGTGERLIKLLFFFPIASDQLHGIHALALRVGEFIAESDVKVKECESMIPLTKRSAGGFMSPLRGC